PRDSRIRSPRTLPTPFFLCTPPPPPHISTLSLHDALPIFGFLGGAQVDRFGNLNTTVIGDYAHPKVRLPGSGGATEIATSCGKTYIVMKQNGRSFVDRLAFITSLGHGPTGTERKALGVRTEGPVLLVSDLCVMTPHRDTR